MKKLVLLYAPFGTLSTHANIFQVLDFSLQCLYKFEYKVRKNKVLLSILIIFVDKCCRCQHVLEIRFVEFNTEDSQCSHCIFCIVNVHKIEKKNRKIVCFDSFTLRKLKTFVMSEHLWPIKIFTVCSFPLAHNCGSLISISCLCAEHREYAQCRNFKVNILVVVGI